MIILLLIELIGNLNNRRKDFTPEGKADQWENSVSGLNSSSGQTESGEQIGHDAGMGQFGIRQGCRAPIVRMGQASMIQAQGPKQCGMQVVDRDNVFDRAVTDVVGATVTVAGLEPSAGQPQREPVTIVVATIFALRDR